MFKIIAYKIIGFFYRLILLRKHVILKRGVSINYRGVNFKGKAVIEPYTRIASDPKITIGKNFYANAFCHFLGKITIGDNVQIGPQTVIWGRDHGIAKGELIRNQEHIKCEIVIEDDVWIAANVVILKGVRVGMGAVVGAGSIVTKDIPPYSIVVGNPARVIKYRE